MIFFRVLTCFIMALTLMGKATVTAEIEKVTISWVPGLCKTTCIAGLEIKLREITQVADLKITPDQGQAELRWKPYTPFTVRPIFAAMSFLGLSINEIRLRVRGTLQHDSIIVTITSMGDDTKFVLLSPVTPYSHEQAPQYSIFSRGLALDTREKLLDAEAQNLVATIEGPLFFPERSPPYQLVIERMKFDTLESK
jgi:hypothetical protein